MQPTLTQALMGGVSLVELELLLQLLRRNGVKELRMAELSVVMGDVPAAPVQEKKPDVSRMVTRDNVPPGVDSRLLLPELGLFPRGGA